MAQTEARSRVPSRAEREAGLHAYLNHSSWNGIGINLLNITMISLLAINFGATNLQIGYISSVFHIAGIILVFVPRMLAGKNIRDVFYWCWLLRGGVSLFYVLVFFLRGQAAVVTIMVVFTAFAALRIVGAPMSQPLQKHLFRPTEIGDAVTRQHFRMSVSQVLSQLLSFAVLSVQVLSGTAGLVLITYLGVAANTVASRYIRNIPSRETVDYRRGRSVYQVFLSAMHNEERRRSLFIRWISLTSTILFGFVVAFLRRSVEMPSNFVFLYTVSVGLAATAASYVLKPFADRVGSKPLLIAATFALAITALGWAIISPSLPWIAYYAFGFLTFFLVRLRLMLITRLLIRSIPERDKISYSAMMNFGSAIVALVVGLGGGALADLGRTLFEPSASAGAVVATGTVGPAAAVGRSVLHFPASSLAHVFHEYSLTFLLAGLLASAAGFVAAGLRDHGSLTLRETADILLSIRNLRAFLNVYRLDTVSDPAKREANLLSLERSSAAIATEDLRGRLRSPSPGQKERIFRSLATYPRWNILPDILDEASDAGSYTRLAAIRTLASYPGRRARALLETLLLDGDDEVVAASLRSLARITRSAPGDRAKRAVPTGAPGHHAGAAVRYTARAWQLIETHPGPRARMDAIRCLSLLGPDDRLIRTLFSVVTPEYGARFEQLSYVSVSHGFRLTPPLATFYHAENIDSGSGVAMLLAECSQFQRFLDARDALEQWFRDGHFDAVWGWIDGQTEGVARNATPAPNPALAADDSSTPSSEAGGGRAQATLLVILRNSPLAQDRPPSRASAVFGVYLLWQLLIEASEPGRSAG